MNDIRLENVTKTYVNNKKEAVKDFTLHIERGSIITLLGPSGCGKTTILRMIAGFESLDKGNIYIAGKLVSGKNVFIPPEKRHVGMVFQDYALFPHLNVFDNIGFGFKNKNRTQRILEVLEMVGLSGYEKRYTHQLSGGQQQRVALARALVRKPSVVLLDEPFSNLDADMRTTMRTEVKRIIKQAQATAVFVSHDQKDALAISDLIVVMKEGVIQQAGSPREIYQYPENRFVASFVGQSNIIEGTIGNDKKTVITKLGTIPCYHTHSKNPGERVSVSIRPDSFEMDTKGLIKGKIKELTYTGKTIDAVVTVTLADNSDYEVLVHVHPENEISIGEILTFNVLPHFTAVLKE